MAIIKRRHHTINTRRIKNVRALVIMSLQLVILLLTVLVLLTYSALHGLPPHLIGRAIQATPAACAAPTLAAAQPITNQSEKLVRLQTERLTTNMQAATSPAVTPVNANCELLATFLDYDFLARSVDDKTASSMAVMIEVFVWSLIGVMARSEYLLSRVLTENKRIGIMEMICSLIGEAASGIAIAVVVIFFLRTIGILSRDANIETIAAFAFILGFYIEHTQNILSSLRDRVLSLEKDTAKGQAS